VLRNGRRGESYVRHRPHLRECSWRPEVSRLLRTRLRIGKLLKLTHDVGETEPRTVVSRIVPAYTPETIVGRRIIYLANLAPKVPPGTRIR
jgi:tRNA-binding EMAP/Myf-like protein